MESIIFWLAVIAFAGCGMLVWLFGRIIYEAARDSKERKERHNE